MKLLLVENSPLVRARIRELLGHVSNLTIIEAASLAESRSLLNVMQPDLAVIDVRLDDGIGLDLIVDIKGRPQTVPIVVISSDPAFRTQSIACGADLFIDKALEFEYLSGLVHGISLFFSNGKYTCRISQ